MVRLQPLCDTSNDLASERMNPVEHSLIRVGALFALYTFYTVQPESSEVKFETVEYITLSIGKHLFVPVRSGC